MSPNEHPRSASIRKLRVLLGDDEAATLMESLHPETGSEFATETDIGVLRSDVEREFAHMDEFFDLRFATQTARFDALLRELLDAQTKLLLFGMIGTMISLAGIMIVASAL